MPVLVGDPRVTVVLGSSASAGYAGACATHTFAPTVCRWNARHTTFTCKEPS